MCDSDDGPLEIAEARLFKWGIRSLYVLLFISCMVVMGYWHVPITYTFLASVFCFILPQLFHKEEEGEREVAETNQIDVDMYFGYITAK